MADYLSEDLRIRVIEAVAGSSRRGAGTVRGVSSAIRWVDVWPAGRTRPIR